MSTGGTLLVTGGGRGIGAATALLAAQRGYALCINYRRDADAAERVAEQARAQGVPALAFRADVADEAQVGKLFRALDDALPPLTALVNNAGIVDRQSRVEDMSATRLRRMFDVNVVASFLCAAEAVRRFRRTGTAGAIVNVSSVASRLGSPGEFVDYAAAKGAIDSFTVGLAREVADIGVRVNAVRPGLIRTDIHADSGEPGRADRLRPAIPAQRIGEPDEVARTILWLLSEEASYVTGAIVDVSGGR
ncbi:MAG: SDR family oxidoreductase [Pseudomonadales bacterium]